MHARDTRPRYRLTIDEYHRMGGAGVLQPDARVELIQGDLIEMAPIGSQHAGAVLYLLNRFILQLAQSAIVGSQNPIVLGSDSEPQPDVLVLRPREDFYRSSHPTREDALLLVEVAETTMQYDRDVKIPLYARHGVPEVWLVDLNAAVVEVYRDPNPDSASYASIRTVRAGTLAPLLAPIAAIDVGELLPKSA